MWLEINRSPHAHLEDHRILEEFSLAEYVAFFNKVQNEKSENIAIISDMREIVIFESETAKKLPVPQILGQREEVRVARFGPDPVYTISVLSTRNDENLPANQLEVRLHVRVTDEAGHSDVERLLRVTHEKTAMRTLPISTGRVIFSFADDPALHLMTVTRPAENPPDAQIISHSILMVSR